MKPRWRLLVSIGVLLAGIVLVGVGGYQVVDTLRFPANASRADGQVTRLAEVSKREKAGSGDNESYVTRTYYHPVVRFVTAREQVVEFRSNTGSRPAAYRVGDSVKVLYDPDNPHKARIDSLSERFSGWLGISLIMLFGLGFTYVGGRMVIDEVRPAPPGGGRRSPSRRVRRRPTGRRRQGRRGSRDPAGPTPAS